MVTATESGQLPLVLVLGCILMGFGAMWSICDSGESWPKAVRQSQARKRKDKMCVPDMQNTKL